MKSQEQTLVINVNLTRGSVALLALALLTAALLSYLAWGHREVAASSPQTPMAPSAGARSYYLSAGIYGGANPLFVCAPGYHFASLWEIMDPSNLEYNGDLGYTRTDGGEGPPSYGGWVRTGYSSYSNNVAGRANCSLWGTSAAGSYGTTAFLPSSWAAGSQDLHIWDVSTASCGDVRRVWCVED